MTSKFFQIIFTLTPVIFMQTSCLQRRPSQDQLNSIWRQEKSQEYPYVFLVDEQFPRLALLSCEQKDNNLFQELRNSNSNSLQYLSSKMQSQTFLEKFSRLNCEIRMGEKDWNSDSLQQEISSKKEIKTRLFQSVTSLSKTIAPTKLASAFEWFLMSYVATAQSRVVAAFLGAAKPLEAWNEFASLPLKQEAVLAATYSIGVGSSLYSFFSMNRKNFAFESFQEALSWSKFSAVIGKSLNEINTSIRVQEDIPKELSLTEVNESLKSLAWSFTRNSYQDKLTSQTVKRAFQVMESSLHRVSETKNNVETSTNTSSALNSPKEVNSNREYLFLSHNAMGNLGILSCASTQLKIASKAKHFIKDSSQFILQAKQNERFTVEQLHLWIKQNEENRTLFTEENCSLILSGNSFGLNQIQSIQSLSKDKFAPMRKNVWKWLSAKSPSSLLSSSAWLTMSYLATVEARGVKSELFAAHFENALQLFQSLPEAQQVILGSGMFLAASSSFVGFMFAPKQTAALAELTSSFGWLKVSGAVGDALDQMEESLFQKNQQNTAPREKVLESIDPLVVIQEFTFQLNKSFAERNVSYSAAKDVLQIFTQASSM